jgi:hypothetical protein
MFDASEIFEKHYKDYCAQITKVDFGSIKERLGIECGDSGDQTIVPFYNRNYVVSNNGIVDASGNRPDYMVCVILSKYILLCPDQSHYHAEWASFKDLRKTSHFLNVNFFKSDTELAIAKHFSGRLDDLFKSCEKLGGIYHEMKTSYDLSMQFNALPRVSLLLLFNDGDEEFPAQCTVLFQRQSEFYLDPESLAMTGAFLARSLKNAS